MEDGLCLSLSLKSFKKSPPPVAPPLKPTSVCGLSSSDRFSSNKHSIFNKVEYFSKSPLEVHSESKATQPAPNTTLNLGWIGARHEGVVDRDMIVVSGPKSGGELSREAGKRCAEREAMMISSDGGGEKKKLRLSKEQSTLLEDTFLEHSTLNNKQKLYLAKQLNLKPRQVEVWFQNRRARTKLRQTEVDCEFLKKYCEKLCEENKRLQKELQELRSPNNLVLCRACSRLTSTADGGGTRRTVAAAAFSRPAVKPNVSGLFSNKTTLLKI